MTDAPWKQVSLPVPLSMEEAAADFVTTLTGRGVRIREEGKLAFIDTWLDPLNSEEQENAIQIYFQDLARRGGLQDTALLRVQEVPEEDWMCVFRSQHTAVRVSERLVVRPTWCEPLGPHDLVLDPGMAFGTGSHPTTKMCLALLDGLAGSPPNGRMLDLGTGSGILAIAGAFLGFADILAVDIDPVAVKVAAENARGNNTENVIRVRKGSIERAKGAYEVITANLSGSVLMDLAERIRPHLAESGYLIASGITTGEKEDVVTSFNRYGLEPVRILEEDVWVAALFQRPGRGQASSQVLRSEI